MELAGAGEHNNGNLGIAENGELVGFLEEAVSSFRVSDLTVGGVLYPLDLDLTASHDLFLSESNVREEGTERRKLGEEEERRCRDNKRRVKKYSAENGMVFAKMAKGIAGFVINVVLSFWFHPPPTRFPCGDRYFPSFSVDAGPRHHGFSFFIFVFVGKLFNFS